MWTKGVTALPTSVLGQDTPPPPRGPARPAHGGAPAYARRQLFRQSHRPECPFPLVFDPSFLSLAIARDLCLFLTLQFSGLPTWDMLQSQVPQTWASASDSVTFMHLVTYFAFWVTVLHPTPQAEKPLQHVPTVFSESPVLFSLCAFLSQAAKPLQISVGCRGGNPQAAKPL